MSAYTDLYKGQKQLEEVVEDSLKVLAHILVKDLVLTEVDHAVSRHTRPVSRQVADEIFLDQMQKYMEWQLTQLLNKGN